MGRIGAIFLDALIHQGGSGISVVAVSESDDTSGKALAQSHNIPVLDIDALIALGESIDILFDLTGSPQVRKTLREKLAAADNRHTIVATESIACMVWSLIAGDEALPDASGKQGY